MFSNFFYAVNRGIRTVATHIMRRLASPSDHRKVDFGRERIGKILLVRPNFRLGNSILALPSIHLFRKNYPLAQIDFVGSPVSKSLISNLPVDHHYQVCRGFPESSWGYPALLARLRREKYDLAVDVSCSQSALGAFIVGLSGSRLKVGKEGKWDFWYDVRISKPAECNKYRILPAFVAAMGLETTEVYPQVILSSAEIAAGSESLRSTAFGGPAPHMGVFVGARRRHGKRWPATKFVRLIRNLTAQGLPVVVFVGPEERDLMGYFKDQVTANTPVIFEPSLRKFAAMVSHCQLFLTCDSGPMHLACALGVRTVAIFQNGDFHRWGPPPGLAKIVHDPQEISVQVVEAACLDEWSKLSASRRSLQWDTWQTSQAATNPAP